MGSSPAARRAGSQHAPRATRVSTPAAEARPAASNSGSSNSLEGQAWSGLSVSSDGRWLYYPRTHRRSSRIVALRRSE